MKKKDWFKNPVVIALASMIMAFGIIFTFLEKVVDFARSPQVLAGQIEDTNKRVDKWADITQQLADQSKEQQIYNKAVADILKQQTPNEEIIYSKDRKSFWDKDKEEWRSIKELSGEP